MTKRTEEAPELALQLVACVIHSDAFLPGDIEQPGNLGDIRDTLTGALSALRQQPVQIGGVQLHARLRRAVADAGSETALALKMGITRQSLSDVLNSRREPGPAVLTYLGLRRVRTHYTPCEYPKAPPEPKPRSERRQRAWDMLPRVQEGISP